MVVLGSVRLVCVVLPVLAACTIDNPRFGDDAGGTAGSTTAGVPTTDGPTTAAPSTSASTSDDTGNDDAVPGETNADTLVTDGGPLDLPGECSLPAFVDLVLTADDTMGPDDDDCAERWHSGDGAMMVEGNTIRLSNCECPCPFDNTAEHELHVEGIELGGLPPCGSITVYPNGEDDTCRWGAFSVHAGLDAEPPRLFASGMLKVPRDVIGEVTVSLGDEFRCDDAACSDAGSYSLEFDNGAASISITMDEAPPEVPVPSIGAKYRVDNVSSVIDTQCVEHVVWMAKAM